MTPGAHPRPAGLLARVFSTDHKVIGKQYLFTGIFFLFFAGLMALLIRWQLAYPFRSVPLVGGLLFGKGGIMGGEHYTMLFTMHGSLMVFFAVTPILIGAMGNFVVPLQIGARDMAYPRLNATSYWILFAGGLVMAASFFVPGGAASAGWTNYPPLSSDRGVTLGQGQTLWLLGIVLAGTSTLLGAINFVATILNLRAPGMTLRRLPLATWSYFFTSVLNVLWVPVVAAALILVLLDRVAGTSFFLAGANAPFEGGQPLLYQHLFWGFGHPEVYILILPVWGILSDLLSVFSRKPAFGYRVSVIAMAAIVAVSGIVWGHHMFTSGMSPLLGKAFVLLTLAVSVPTALLFLNWLGTLWKGSIRFEPPMVYALGIVFVFAVGGLTGVFNALQAFDIYIHDTYFVVAHFHYTLAASVFLGSFAAISYWFPKMFGRRMNARLSVVHFLLSFLLLNVVFLAMFRMGIAGMPRRVADPFVYEYLQPMRGWSVLAGWGTLGLGLVQLLFAWDFFRSLRAGPAAPANPWGAATLEWSVASPPPPHNFERTPRVAGGPHEYGRPGPGGRDWVPQDEEVSLT
ncbi:MAG: cbb3-type cytochrome c oxidase subunit I [Planctomycetes bacterium]|nr:cbb3-type cytochrome c oxidase subunit I [Planctomycetota bacterium]